MDISTIADRSFAKFPENLGESHGSPKDRGSADCYYGRNRDPHYYPNGTYNEPKIGNDALTHAERNAYNTAYDSGDFDAKHHD